MSRYIDIQYLSHAFWTCPGIGIRIRIKCWQASFVVGLPNIFNKLINKPRKEDKI